jgi:putative effector of murein hydrolase LrgA (UPF0299 family)
MNNLSGQAGFSANCPHCGFGNPAGASFCGKCGKAVSTGGSGPRIVEGKGLASSGVGKHLQSEELEKQAKRASGALLAVAVLSTLGVLLVLGLAGELRKIPDGLMIANILIVSQVVVAAAFWALWFWSRSNPLPAAIVGLVVYLSLMAVNAITVGPRTLASGLLIKIIIVVVLVSAIQAGIQHRQLQKST